MQIRARVTLGDIEECVALLFYEGPGDAAEWGAHAGAWGMIDSPVSGCRVVCVVALFLAVRVCELHDRLTTRVTRQPATMVQSARRRFVSFAPARLVSRVRTGSRAPVTQIAERITGDAAVADSKKHAGARGGMRCHGV
jgi:hypothetical protein